MSSTAKKIVLPKFSLTKVSESPVDGATSVSLPRPGQSPLTYYTVPEQDELTREWTGNKGKWVTSHYHRFPLVLCGDGSPWAEANLFLLHRLEKKVEPDMVAFGTVASDLAAFRRYIEESGIDWLEFPAQRYRRPTYRYRASLTIAIQACEIKDTVAKRRMAYVIQFYRWLMSSCHFTPAHSMWDEQDRYIDWKNDYGGSGTLHVVSTDVSIKIPKSEDPWSGKIMDGGSLRPLPQDEQEALMATLDKIDNTEMSLIHELSLFSGARIQSVLTVRVHHVSRDPEELSGSTIGIRAGPKYGIDTKRGKEGVLHLPRWLYKALYIYAKSDRAKRRRLMADGGDKPEQFLFLSNRGACLYDTNEQRRTATDGRHPSTGQAVRQFIKEKVLPEMRARLNDSNYSYRFHDLRATFGMNFVDDQAPLMDAGKVTYLEVLGLLQARMWHNSLSSTEKYLKFRKDFSMLHAAQQGWSERLTALAQSVLTGLTSEGHNNENH